MSNSKTKEAPPTKEKKRKTQGYCVELPEGLYDKLQRHIKVLQALESGNQTKKDWVHSAVYDYLKNKTGSTPLVGPKTKKLNFHLDNDLYHKLEETVGSLKEQGQILTKRQIFIEAIRDKILTEEPKLMSLLEKARTGFETS